MSTASVAPPPLATPPKDADIRDQALGLSTAKGGKALRLAQLDTFIMHAQQPRWQWLQRMHRNDGKKQSSRVLKAFFDVERSLEANEKGRRSHRVAQSAKGMVSGTSSDLLDPASMSPTGHHSFPSGSTDSPSAKLVVRRPKSAHGSSKQPPKWDHSTSIRPTRAAAKMVRERGLGLSSAYRRQPPGQSKLIGTLRARLSQLEQLNALASTPVELHTNALALKGRSSRATSKARGHQTEIEQLRRRLRAETDAVVSGMSITAMLPAVDNEAASDASADVEPEGLLPGALADDATATNAVMAPIDRSPQLQPQPPLEINTESSASMTEVETPPRRKRSAKTRLRSSKVHADATTSAKAILRPVASPPKMSPFAAQAQAVVEGAATCIQKVWRGRASRGGVHVGEQDGQ